MSQKEKLLQLFRSHNNQLTLAQILTTYLAAEYRARMTDLRHDGYSIVCQRGKIPSENIYRLIESSPTIKFESDGQAVFF